MCHTFIDRNDLGPDNNLSLQYTLNTKFPNDQLHVTLLAHLKPIRNLGLALQLLDPYCVAA